MAEKKRKQKRTSPAAEERRLERERYDERTRLLEERVTELVERLKDRRKAS